MANENKRTVNLNIISIIVTIGLFLWFTFRAGLIGTFHWHRDIFTYYLILLVTAFLPLIFGLIFLFKRNKITRILVKVFSIFSISLWIIVYLGLTVLGAIPANTKDIPLLTQKDVLPLSHEKENPSLIAHYAFASDPHWGSSNADAQARINIMNQIEKNDYDAFFCLGDISEVGMIPSFYKEAVNDISSCIKTTPTMILPGNHDGIVNGMPAFKKTFMKKGDKMYYRMDNGPVHVIVLYMLWDDAEFSKRQEKWLVKQLEEIPEKDTVIVLSHCYVLSSGYWDEAAKKNWGDIPSVVKRLTPIFEKYHVDLHLSGHDHFFEDLEKDDVDYFVLGAMGGKLDKDFVYNSPYSKWLNNTDFGYVDLKIYERKIILTVYTQYGDAIYSKEIETR
ncbi:MAG: metallophosphoesterase [Treponema sp.]|nr:metallophosphoesterase [Treponema sp.]